MSTEVNPLSENLKNVQERIAASAKIAGKNPENITLIAVTKTIEPERIIQVIDQGILNLGENRVQELREKYDIIKRECNWHLIGHLQTNKVKYIIDKVAMIHSVDRLELAEEINIRAGKVNRIMEILVQVNVSGEESKFGIAPEAVREFIYSIKNFPNLKVKGLMTIGPNTENKAQIRHVFRQLNKIFIDIKQENIDNIDMDTLSMGMSGDFEIAIEEGANVVRVGSAIFGKRLPVK